MEVDPVQRLHEAAEQGDLEYIQGTVDAGLEVDCRDHDNNTALHIAAANDQEAVVVVLLAQGAQREATNNMGWTPLMQAARHGHMQVVAILVHAGVALDTQNKLGMTALMLASVSGHMGTIRTLVDAGANYDPVPSTNRCQITPLMIAAQHGNDAVVRLYLDKGVNANRSIPKTGITPLMFSAAGGNLSTAQILLDRGADPNSLSAADLTALDVAAASNRPDISNCLQKKTTRQKKRGALCDMMDAARRGDIKAVQEILLVDHAQCQVPTAEGATPLMVAAMLGHIQVAQLLLQYGADINAQDLKNGWTALMQAIYHRQTDMAKFLIQRGADIYRLSLRGYTAFDFASEMLDTDVMRIFVEAQLPALGLGSSAPTPQPAWTHKSNSSVDLADAPSKLGIKHWWSRVSNKLQKVKGGKGTAASSAPEPDSPGELNLMPPLVPPIVYDPIFPQQVRLSPIMDFDAGSVHVNETMKSMEPPYISPTGGKPGLMPKVMPPGRKILPGTQVQLPRHATNARLLRWTTGGPSPGSSLHSPQSSGEGKVLRELVKARGVKGVAEGDLGHQGPLKQPVESELLVSSLESSGSGSGSGSSSLKTLNSSKSSKSGATTSTLVPAGGVQDTPAPQPHHLTLSLGSGQLADVLHKLALDHYLEVFMEQEVDLEAFLELSHSDLQDLGISSLEAREKVLAAIASLKPKLHH